MSPLAILFRQNLPFLMVLLGGILLGILVDRHTHKADPGYWAPMGADWITPAGTPCYAWEGSYTNPMTGKDGGKGQPMYLICTLR